MCDLYDSLTKSSERERVNVEQLRSNIAALDIEGQTYIFALIYYHYQREGMPPPNLAERVTIDLNTLPKPLLRILGRFATMHLEKMTADNELSAARQLAAIAASNRIP